MMGDLIKEIDELDKKYKNLNVELEEIKKLNVDEKIIKELKDLLDKNDVEYKEIIKSIIKDLDEYRKKQKLLETTPQQMATSLGLTSSDSPQQVTTSSGLTSSDSPQ